MCSLSVQILILYFYQLLWIYFVNMFTCLLYYLPVATRTNYQKPSDSKYHKFIFLNFGGQKSKLFPYLAAFLLEALREKLFLALSTF